jgi:hypothetical protein
MNPIRLESSPSLSSDLDLDLREFPILAPRIRASAASVQSQPDLDVEAKW